MYPNLLIRSPINGQPVWAVPGVLRSKRCYNDSFAHTSSDICWVYPGPETPGPQGTPAISIPGTCPPSHCARWRASDTVDRTPSPASSPTLSADVWLLLIRFFNWHAFNYLEVKHLLVFTNWVSSPLAHSYALPMYLLLSILCVANAFPALWHIRS